MDITTVTPSIGNMGVSESSQTRPILVELVEDSDVAAIAKSGRETFAATFGDGIPKNDLANLIAGAEQGISTGSSLVIRMLR